MKFNIEDDNSAQAKAVLMQVFAALEEKGYDPIVQMVGYFISGDPSYITSHNNARALIHKLDRDELLSELLRFYIDAHEGQ
ncbi:IreB family regulatory phosphoprotein [Mahella australiensis]|nr:IreB family regulatory phosphoprotein [Mahella australiensis]